MPRKIAVSGFSPAELERRRRGLENVLRERRSVRRFRPAPPSREAIEQILDAGLSAPFAELTHGATTGYRRFAVLSAGSPALAMAEVLFERRIAATLAQLRTASARVPGLAGRTESYLARLSRMRDQGVEGVGTAPYYIVVAERRGVPAAEQQALAHCLENMWLMATALGLGFHLVSVTALMGRDRAFCELIGVPTGAFELNGCAVGVAAPPIPQPRARPSVEETTSWL